MRVIAIALGCLLAFGAVAQEPGEPLSKPSASGAAQEADAEATALYRLGLDLAAKGQYAEACGVFDKITKEHPRSEYAAKAEEQMALAALAEGGAACGGAPPASPSRAPGSASSDLPPSGFERRLALSRGKGDEDGRVELVISQALVGPALFGLMIPASAGVDVPWVYLTGGLVGLGAGIGVPLWITAKNPVSTGQAMVIFSGEAIGAWNGFFIMAAIPGIWDNDNAFQVVNIGSTAGLLAGGTGGVIGAIALKPTSGQASMFRSGFTWGAYFGATSIALTNGTSGVTETMLRMGLTSDVGAALGAVAATQWPVSRSRMNVINLSGYAGALGLGLIYGIISLGVQDTSAPVWGAVLTAGAAGGLVAGGFLTKNMDEKRLAWIGGGTPIALEGKEWSFGMPLPTPRVAPDGSIGVDLQIAAGRW